MRWTDRGRVACAQAACWLAKTRLVCYRDRKPATHRPRSPHVLGMGTSGSSSGTPTERPTTHCAKPQVPPADAHFAHPRPAPPKPILRRRRSPANRSDAGFPLSMPEALSRRFGAGCTVDCNDGESEQRSNLSANLSDRDYASNCHSASTTYSEVLSLCSNCKIFRSVLDSRLCT
jgi:hypothetical protein